VHVSNELGAGNPKGARLVVVVAFAIVMCSALLVSVTLLSLRHFIGIAFSNEEEVIDYVTRMVPLLSISVLADNFQGVLTGTCVASHRTQFVDLCI
jgi:multidrug resistance protein, MATE family